MATFTPSSVTVTPDTTKINGGVSAVKSGNTVQIYLMNVVPQVAISSDTTIATITSAFPTDQVFGVCKNIQNDDVLVFVTTTGSIKIAGVTGAPVNKQIYGTLTYFTTT